METLSTHSRHDIGVANAVRQRVEMHSAKAPASGSMKNPAATRITPRGVAMDNEQEQEQKQSQSQTSERSSSQGGNRSNVSSQTDITWPTPTVSSQQDQSQKSRQDDASQVNGRLRTPEDQARSKQEVVVVSPARHKRTASGLLKAVDSPDMRPRAESVSSSGSKAGEVSCAAVQLKTRLAYAMAKVQHGWEHRNINEVEQLAAALPPRTTASSPTMNPPNRLHSPPAKRPSGSGFVSWSLPNPSQPQIEVHSSREDRQVHSSQEDRRSSSSSNVPSTPKTRPPPLRPVTQQAEQDAMDALMLMGGSPGNGGKFPPLSQTSSSSQQQPQSQATGQAHASTALLSPRRSESVTEPAPTAAQKSPHRLGSIGRSHSSASDVSVAASEVREARERILDEAEDAA